MREIIRTLEWSQSSVLPVRSPQHFIHLASSLPRLLNGHYSWTSVTRWIFRGWEWWKSHAHPPPSLGWQINSMVRTIRNITNLLHGVIFRPSEISPLKKVILCFFKHKCGCSEWSNTGFYGAGEWWKSHASPLADKLILWSEELGILKKLGLCCYS